MYITYYNFHLLSDSAARKQDTEKATQFKDDYQ